MAKDQIVDAIIQFAYSKVHEGLPPKEIVERLAYGLGRFAMNISMTVEMGVKTPRMSVLQEVEAMFAQGFKDEGEEYHAIKVS